MRRVLKQISKAKVVDVTAEDAQAEAERQYEIQFQRWKNSYYTEKFGWDMSNEQEMKSLAESYVRGLQWVLYYYYRGIASWPWFYAYHYSPMISDVKLGLGADLNFHPGATVPTHISSSSGRFCRTEASPSCQRHTGS